MIVEDRHKFRAFDKQYNKMYYKVLVGNVDPNDDENYTAHGLWVTPDKVNYKCEPHWCNFDENSDIVLMQCTGVRDWNNERVQGKGVLMYESDLVQCEYYPNSRYGDNSPLTWVGVVEWSTDGSFHVVRYGEHAGTYSLNFSGSIVKRWEVIGNVHESPELVTR